MEILDVIGISVIYLLWRIDDTLREIKQIFKESEENKININHLEKMSEQIRDLKLK